MDYTKYYMEHNLFCVGVYRHHWKQLELVIQCTKGIHLAIVIGPLYVSLTHHNKAEREFLTEVYKEMDIERNKEACDD